MSQQVADNTVEFFDGTKAAQLTEICWRVRRACFSDNDRTAGCCFNASIVLICELMCQSFTPYLIEGEFTDPYSDDFSYHDWVIVDGLICDITADQFSDDLEEAVPEVLVLGASIADSDYWNWIDYYTMCESASFA